MFNEYHFFTEWRFKASVQELQDILMDATDLPRWWPSVYIEAERMKEGDFYHLGEEIRLYTKGFLPYTLRWDFTVTHLAPLTLEARGDFSGRGIWTYELADDEVILRYDWKVRAEKPLLKHFSIFLKPIFSWNHEWAMAKGKQSIELELARRRAITTGELQAVPPPPAPTPSNPLDWLLMPFGKKVS